MAIPTSILIGLKTERSVKVRLILGGSNRASVGSHKYLRREYHHQNYQILHFPMRAVAVAGFAGLCELQKMSRPKSCHPTFACCQPQSRLSIFLYRLYLYKIAYAIFLLCKLYCLQLDISRLFRQVPATWSRCAIRSGL